MLLLRSKKVTAFLFTQMILMGCFVHFLYLKINEGSFKSTDDGASSVRSFLLQKFNISCRAMNKSEFDTIPQIPETQCSSPYVESQHGGRLGNQICRYMSLWLFRKNFGVRVILQAGDYEALKKYFPKLTIPHRENACFPLNESSSTQLVFSGLYDKFYESFVGLKKNEDGAQPISHRNVLQGFPCDTDMITHYRSEFRSEFQFKQEIITEAQAQINLILKESNYERSKVTLVSVHVRRSDYQNFSMSYEWTFPTYIYFLQIMNNFRKRYDNAVFAIFSDDIEYYKTYLAGPDTIYPGKGNNSDPITDFAMITICDHHIFGLGTFSFTSAVLGGGSMNYGFSDHFNRETPFYYHLCNPFLTPVIIKPN